MNRPVFKSLAVVAAFLCAVTISAQSNLLLNPDAEMGTQHWVTQGQATIEDFNGTSVFAVRYGCTEGSGFIQDVDLTESDTGKYALLIGRGSSERINSDRSITGLPSLYGYMLRSKTTKGATINTYLQGQMMLGRASVPNQWVTMYGIFRVPERTVAIRFFLNQAERKHVPQNGSAARFDDLGLYLFASEREALDFVRAYR
jgi:hypothetical protein